MRVDIVIPARYASSRLPGKPLLKSTGKFLIQHVYERALQAKFAHNVLIATDDPRIQAAVASFGGQCVMTRRDHVSGTDRIAEVARNLDGDVIINLQGDEPEIDPGHLDLLPDLLLRNPAASVATLATPIADAETWRSPNCVKVVCDDNGSALYFSRSPIPYLRDGLPDFRGPPRFLQHVGLYAYRRDFLLELASQPPGALELTEKLEQLRVLAMGQAIQVGIVAHAGRGVDTMEDYERFRRSLRRPKAMAA
jgi:3-deoxy-manno-octulosonate cytidylyltransferase (CMP-KDO synthetase)